MQAKNIRDKVIEDNQLPETAVLQEEVVEEYDLEARDHLWFGLKIGENECKIGLSDILRCLKFAEEQGEVPKIPSEWWSHMAGVYCLNELGDYD